MLDDATTHNDATTDASIIRIDRKKGPQHENLPEDEDKEDPDIYDVNVLAWDTPVSPLHLAIANGHIETVRSLVQDFGADLLLPVKLVNDFNKSARAAILPLVLALQLAPQKATEMTKVLIALGASPAQADTDHITALHYFAAYGADILNTMITADRPAAERAVGHLSMSGHQYSPMARSTIHAAIEKKDAAGVDALLDLGASPEVDYSAYVTSYKSRWDLTGDAENNQKQFRQNFTQPVFSAVHHDMPSAVLKLLGAGADINSINPGAWMAINRSHYNNDSAASLLDAVRKKITTLCKIAEKGEKPEEHYRCTCHMKFFRPLPLKDDQEYLEGHDPKSYIHWSTVEQLAQAKDDYERDVKRYEEATAPKEETEEMLEKKSAAKSLLAEFEALESHLVERGAKRFVEIHPDIKLQENQSHQYHNREPEPPKPWGPRITFKLPDLTDERRDGYLKLFEACWEGNMTTVKELTLAVWDNKQSPLKIAVQDFSGFSPFSIAILRRHVDIARAVLEIAHAQYAPTETPGHMKHTVHSKDDDDDMSDEDDDYQIYSEIVDDRFTVEDIGAVQNQVKSNVKPLALLSWSCPVWRFLEDGELSSTTAPPASSGFGQIFNHRYRNLHSAGRSPWKVLKHARNDRTYQIPTAPSPEMIPEISRPGNLYQFAIFLNDTDLLHFLIAMGEDATRRKVNDVVADEAKVTFFEFAEQDFLYAIRLGRVQLLDEIVKRTGVGIPLDDLVRKSGVALVEQPKYYQGLSVHGKKRADWANVGRDTQCDSSQQQHPPLLHAARLASLESVEWFLGDAALRCYTEFANNHRDDVRIQNLGKAKGGIDASVTNWLNLRSHLLLHCVVLGKTTDDALQLLRHLCRTRPGSLEHRSSDGHTALQLAFRLHKAEMIKILIEAGADQTCRNNAGDNIIHSLLHRRLTSVEKDVPQINELLGLIDPRILSSLFVERSTQLPGAATPLSCWLYTMVNVMQYAVKQTDDREKYVQAILAFSKGEDLSIINGEGDTPVHAAVRYGADAILRTMLEHRSELLFRENATGRTPYEMAEEAYLAKEVFSDPPSVSASARSNRRHYSYTNGFGGQNSGARVKGVWDVCREFAEKAGVMKRDLVKLVEANEVAKRLAKDKGRRRGAEAEVEDVDQEKHKEAFQGDEVTVWFDMALNA